MIGSADITNAYFPEQELDRVLILRQPKVDSQKGHQIDVFWLEYLFMGLMAEDASFGSASKLVLFKPEAEPIIEQLLSEFSCGKIERREFRYCGGCSFVGHTTV